MTGGMPSHTYDCIEVSSGKLECQAQPTQDTGSPIIPLISIVLVVAVALWAFRNKI